MWLFLPCGFYSVVEKSRGDILTVRARARADLERLREQWLPELSPTQKGGGTDYPYRATATRAQLAAALGRFVESLGYANFKDEVRRELGGARAHLCSEVWRVMYDAERAEPRRPAGGRRSE